MEYHISYFKPPSKPLSNAEVDQNSALIFTGPSRLPRLEDLHITYFSRAIFYGTEGLDAYLDTIYLHNLNRTIEDPNSFPSLRTFQTDVFGGVTVEVSLLRVLSRENIVARMMDRLPAIFGVGGRRETRGWITSVESSLRVGSDD